jgi:glutaredoxin 2
MVNKDFNTKSFINYHDYKDEDAFIKRIIELDNNDAAYLSMLKEPWYNDNELPNYMREQNIIIFFEKVFSSKGKFTPVSKTTRKYFYQSSLYLQRIDQFLNRKLRYRKNFR